MGNIHMKLYEIRTSGSGRDVILKKKFMDRRRTYGRTKTDQNTSP